jgi:hypothetical protein
MDANSVSIQRLKLQVNKFSGILSKGLKKTHQRFIKEMLYGIQASKDVKLSNISRALQEEIALIKTEERLSRNLGEEDLTEHINQEILRLGHDKVNEHMVIAIDPGDIEKPYAKKMEYLCPIYDGSEHQQATGYHLCQVTAANLEHDKVVPLYCEAYSSKEDGYISSTEKINTIISRVVAAIGRQGTWAIDRQGDNIDIIKHFEKEQLRFVTRLKLNRYLHFNHNRNKQTRADNLYKFVMQWHEMRMVQIEDNQVKHLILTYGAIPVAFPDIADKWYTLIIIKGFGEQPMLLLTNKEVDIEDAQELHHIVNIYLTRWKCDECYRYIKQSYNLEDVRVMSYIRIRNITAFVHAIAYFCSIYLGASLKLKIMVQKIYVSAKRFFGIPVFYDYAIADGIYEILKKSSKGIIGYLGKIGKAADEFQLSLFPK